MEYLDDFTHPLHNPPGQDRQKIKSRHELDEILNAASLDCRDYPIDVNEYCELGVNYICSDNQQCMLHSVDNMVQPLEIKTLHSENRFPSFASVLECSQPHSDFGAFDRETNEPDWMFELARKESRLGNQRSSMCSALSRFDHLTRNAQPSNFQMMRWIHNEQEGRDETEKCRIPHELNADVHKLLSAISSPELASFGKSVWSENGICDLNPFVFNSLPCESIEHPNALSVRCSDRSTSMPTSPKYLSECDMTTLPPCVDVRTEPASHFSRLEISLNARPCPPDLVPTGILTMAHINNQPHEAIAFMTIVHTK